MLTRPIHRADVLTRPNLERNGRNEKKKVVTRPFIFSPLRGTTPRYCLRETVENRVRRDHALVDKCGIKKNVLVDKVETSLQFLYNSLFFFDNRFVIVFILLKTKNENWITNGTVFITDRGIARILKCTDDTRFVFIKLQLRWKMSSDTFQ